MEKFEEVLSEVARQYARRLVDVHLGNIEARAQLRYRIAIPKEWTAHGEIRRVRMFIEAIHGDGDLARTFGPDGLAVDEEGGVRFLVMLSDACDPETIPEYETREVPVDDVADKIEEIRPKLREVASTLTGSRVVVPTYLGGFCVSADEYVFGGKGSPRLVSIAFEVPSLELESVTEQVHVRDEVIPLPTEIVEMSAP